VSSKGLGLGGEGLPPNPQKDIQPQEPHHSMQLHPAYAHTRLKHCNTQETRLTHCPTKQCCNVQHI
jgi:hypothetical protein